MNLLIESNQNNTSREHPWQTIETLKSTHQNAPSQIHQIAKHYLQQEIAFIYDPSFEDVEYSDVEREATGPHIFASATKHQLPSSSRLPAYIAGLYETRLLSAKGEAALFRKMNYLKYLANGQRSSIDPSHPCESQIDKIESLLKEAREVRTQLVKSNLRLVVSIARRYADEAISFDELVSEGNLILLNAVEKFDYSRGFRFSTYLTHAVQRHYYRQFQKAQRRSKKEVVTSEEILREAAADTTHSDQDEIAAKSAVSKLFATMKDRLDDRECYIVRERFGFNAAGKVRTLQSLSGDLGICKERVRQLFHTAVAKLRDLACELKIDFDMS